MTVLSDFMTNLSGIMTQTSPSDSAQVFQPLTPGMEQTRWQAAPQNVVS
jgi:hypothetical protein